MDRQQELFTYLLVKLREKGYTVYDTGAPGPNTTYPYILLGELQEVDSPTKSSFVSNIYPTIHVYQNNIWERGTLSEIVLDIKNLCRAYCAEYGLGMTGISTRILNDNTTSVPLLHAVIEPTFLR